MRSLALGFFCCLTINIFAQIDTSKMVQTPKSATKVLELLKTQVGISDATYFDQIMGVVSGIGSNSQQLLAAQSVKAYMMPPRKAGDKDWLDSYAVTSCLEFYINNGSNYKVNLSPDYVQLSLRKGDKFAKTHDAFQFLMNDGTVSAAILPYGASAISSAVYATQKYQIKNYLHLFRPDTKSKQKIYEARKALMRGHPVMVQMKVDAGFDKLENTRYWTPSATTKDSKTTVSGIIVGYDEDLQAFELLSFKGTEWGNNGYILVDYDDFSNYAEEGYVLVYR